eukprot:gnl/MRDRNA2_/MRDRNA2_93836_c0_seq1.p1 gnl/MRDRNA2_/MRDRNA2_93836_c0~~gnl/MRDRNA2_/MRDRNA2_93836_c0_seq1.p1  ORF type:complete len:517 (-),score=160.19 gnl/MRDRNA2_/MRDRNA2_93836_c0_seq1:134-1684(-)
MLGDIQVPDLESPRHKCALRQLGVVPEQLQPLDTKALEREGLSADAIELRVSLHEKKRKAILQNLKAAAKGVTPRDLESYRSVETSSKRLNMSKSSSSKSPGKAFITGMDDPSVAEMMAKESNRLHKLQESMKNELAQTLIKEIEAKELMAERAKRDAIIKQKHQEEALRLKKAGEERQVVAAKKQQKREDIAAKAAAEMKALAEENAKKAAEKMEKIEAQKQKNAEARALAQQEKDAKITMRKADRAEKEDQAFQALLNELEVKAQRDEAIEKRRKEIREHLQQRAEERQREFEQCRHRVDEQRNKDEQKRQAFYAEHSERMDKAMDVLDSLDKARLKEVADRNKVRTQRFEKSLARTMSESALEKKRLDEKFFDKFGKSFKEEQRQRQEEFAKSLRERRNASEELVQSNRGMLHRAAVFYEDQKRVGINNKTEKVNNIKSSRRDIQTQRVNALQKCWIEKNHMDLIFDRVKYVNNPQTLYKIASSVGVDVHTIQARGEVLSDGQLPGHGHGDDD